jgi:ABC-type Na+ efflux pump permease subunit
LCHWYIEDCVTVLVSDSLVVGVDGGGGGGGVDDAYSTASRKLSVSVENDGDNVNQVKTPLTRKKIPLMMMMMMMMMMLMMLMMLMMMMMMMMMPMMI